MPEKTFPFSVDLLDSPAILIDATILDQNLRDMQALADRHGVNLRPHIKTHKSPVLALRQMEAGAIGIAVAKVSEAEIMASHGLFDIQIANQVVAPQKMHRLLGLAGKCRLSCALDSAQNARDLSSLFESNHHTLDVLIEVDTGLHRCGLQSIDEIVALARLVCELHGLNFSGLMTHAGHAYGARSAEELKAIGTDEGESLVRAAEAVRSAGIPVAVVSVGSTPTARYASAVKGVTELRVGNYVFNDAIQVALGVAPIERCALSVLATVISTPDPERAVIDAGSKAFTSDSGAHGRRLVHGFGQLIGKKGELERLSEEHGVIKHVEQEKFTTCERLRIIPNHACAVVNMFDVAYLIEGNLVVGQIDIEARGCTS
jgi:D-serine deaminase-like pyridoxal phosphate-dependent protein